MNSVQFSKSFGSFEVTIDKFSSIFDEHHLKCIVQQKIKRLKLTVKSREKNKKNINLVSAVDCQ